jgi:hypothetical protein
MTTSPTASSLSEEETLRIPGHLTRESQRWLGHLLDAYDFTITQWEVALLAADARDRAAKAARTLNREGQTVAMPVVNRKGDVVAHRHAKHPAADIARDAAATYSRLVAQLDLVREED